MFEFIQCSIKWCMTHHYKLHSSTKIAIFIWFFRMEFSFVWYFSNWVIVEFYRSISSVWKASFLSISDLILSTDKSTCLPLTPSQHFILCLGFRPIWSRSQFLQTQRGHCPRLLSGNLQCSIAKLRKTGRVDQPLSQFATMYAKLQVISATKHTTYRP